MKLILGGTSATHRFIETLETDDYVITVATDYGEREFGLKYPGYVMKIRFSEDSLSDFIRKNGVDEIIDTTHPYAAEITAIAKKTAAKCGVKYTDMVRKTDSIIESSLIHLFADYEETCTFLKVRKFNNILFTTGGNNIHLFSQFAENGWVRILPYEKSIEKCTQAGFERPRIIAMQGPFSTEFNIALCRELNIDCVVSKNSGEGSGFLEKVNACLSLKIDLAVINPPEEEKDR